MQIKIEVVPDDHAGGADSHSVAEEQSLTGTMDPLETYAPEDPMSASTGTLISPEATPPLQVAYTAQRRQSWLEDTLGYVHPRAFLNPRAIGLALFTVIASVLFYAPFLYLTGTPVCTTTIGGISTFCGGPSDVVVVYDFAALAQIHTMTLSRLYESAEDVWKHADDLAHSARLLKESAFYVKDSTLASRDALSSELHKLNGETKDASESLAKLTAATVGTITRTQFSFGKVLTVLYEAQDAVVRGISGAAARALEIKLQQTFRLAQHEASEDLHALQNVTYFTLGDLAIVEAHLGALDAAARREDRALGHAIEDAAVTGWFRDRAREARLDELLEDAVVLENIRVGCREARGVVLESHKSTAAMLAQMEYLSSLPTTRLLLDGTALNELIADIEGYKMLNDGAAKKFDEERAEMRRAKFALAGSRGRVGVAQIGAA